MSRENYTYTFPYEKRCWFSLDVEVQCDTTCCCQIMDTFTIQTPLLANITHKTTSFTSCKPKSISIIPPSEENELIMMFFTNKMADKRILVPQIRQDYSFVPSKHFSEWSAWCLFQIVAWDKFCEERSSRKTHCLQSVISETSISGI